MYTTITMQFDLFPLIRSARRCKMICRSRPTYFRSLSMCSLSNIACLFYSELKINVHKPENTEIESLRTKHLNLNPFSSRQEKESYTNDCRTNLNRTFPDCAQSIGV